MKTRLIAPLAVLALLASPASLLAAKPASGEIELHIEASAQVPPDRALVPVVVSGTGASEGEAKADLARNEENLLDGLAKKGVDRSKVKPASLDPDGNAVIGRDDPSGAACAAAEAAAAAATAAAADAAAPRKSSRKRKIAAEGATCGDEPMFYFNKTLMVEVADMALLAELSTEADGSYSYGRIRPVFSQSDPAAARQKAREQALAKARADAAAYAAAMGYHVVRVVRVSNAKPLVNMAEMMGLFGMIDARSSTMQPSYFGAITFESVAMDFAIAPN